MDLADYKNYYKDLLILQYKTQKKARETVGSIVSQTGCTGGEFGKAQYYVVGAPTLVDGIASGFTKNDYLLFNIPLEIEDTDSLEVCVKFTTGLSFNHTFESVFGTACGMFGFYLTDGGELRGVYRDSDGTHDNLVAGGIQFNTTYYAKLVRQDTSAVLSISQDGKTWEDIIYSNDDQHTIGANPYYMVMCLPFTGSLDLNVSYVRVNGKVWGGYAITTVDLPSMIINGFDLNTAEGKNLDILGKYIGLKRTVKALIGNTNTNVLNDDQYRLLLKLKLIKNTNYSSTSQLRVALYAVFPASIRLFDNRDMTYEYQLSSLFNDLINVIVAEEILPVPMALGYTAVVVPNLLALYGYYDYGGLNNNPNGYSSYQDGFRGRFLSYGDKFAGEE